MSNSVSVIICDMVETFHYSATTREWFEIICSFVYTLKRWKFLFIKPSAELSTVKVTELTVYSIVKTISVSGTKTAFYYLATQWRHRQISQPKAFFLSPKAKISSGDQPLTVGLKGGQKSHKALVAVLFCVLSGQQELSCSPTVNQSVPVGVTELTWNELAIIA